MSNNWSFQVFRRNVVERVVRCVERGTIEHWTRNRNRMAPERRERDERYESGGGREMGRECRCPPCWRTPSYECLKTMSLSCIFAPLLGSALRRGRLRRRRRAAAAPRPREISVFRSPLQLCGIKSGWNMSQVPVGPAHLSSPTSPRHYAS